MVELNPKIKKILGKYKIKPSIDTKTLRELASGHMNDTCRIAIGIYSVLSENWKSQIKKNTIKEACINKNNKISSYYEGTVDADGERDFEISLYYNETGQLASSYGN